MKKIAIGIIYALFMITLACGGKQEAREDHDHEHHEHHDHDHDHHHSDEKTVKYTDEITYLLEKENWQFKGQDKNLASYEVADKVKEGFVIKRGGAFHLIENENRQEGTWELAEGGKCIAVKLSGDQEMIYEINKVEDGKALLVKK